MRSIGSRVYYKDGIKNRRVFRFKVRKVSNSIWNILFRNTPNSCKTQLNSSHSGCRRCRSFIFVVDGVDTAFPNCAMANCKFFSD
ncbi:hypothetical protein Plhal304r1_c031g0100931 [Plasmopara halstedii]